MEIRLSEKEYDRLHSLAASDPSCVMKRSGRPSISSYIRKRIIRTGRDPDDMREEVRSLTYQVRKAGININQAVKKINAGLYDGMEIRELLAGQRRMETLLTKISSVRKKEGG